MVQHAHIACVSQNGISFRYDRHSSPGRVVATASEREEKLVLMPQFDVVHQMFYAHERASEDEDIFLCVCVEGKTFTNTDLPSSLTGIHYPAARPCASCSVAQLIISTLDSLQEGLWASLSECIACLSQA